MHTVNADPHAAASLRAAFAATDYLVDTGHGPVRVRVGERHEQLDSRLGGESWAIVTAFNPGARRSSASANDHADQALASRLAARSPQVLLRSRHVDPAGDWPVEWGWLFAPAQADEADRIGRAFGQAAIVHALAGEPATLRFCGAPSAPGALTE
jgi:hypothetical protein